MSASFYIMSIETDLPLTFLAATVARMMRKLKSTALAANATVSRATPGLKHSNA